MAQLLFYRGDEKLIEYRLAGGRTSIGRADSCDVALPGDAISRTHCFVVQRDGAYEVIDRSRHGITVDGQQSSAQSCRTDRSLESEVFGSCSGRSRSRQHRLRR